jgi:hypothetical protein
VLAAALVCFFVITLDAVIVNVVLPSIRDDLGGGVTGLQWVVDGYTLTFAALLLSAGSLSDRIGARRAFGLDWRCSCWPRPRAGSPRACPLSSRHGWCKARRPR